MSDLTEANRLAFNDRSEDYDERHHKITQQIAAALEERKEWTLAKWLTPEQAAAGREVKLLDYACGTGSITRAIGPWVTHVKGIDISENMVQKYNDAARASGLREDQVNAVVGDLLAEEEPEHLKTPEWYNFDVAVIGLGFHHFDQPVRAVQRLNERLKPGVGVLLIIDFLPFNEEERQEEGSSNETIQTTIKHSGFEQKNIETLFKIAKFQNFSFSVIDDPAILEMQSGTKKRYMFVARGVKEPGAWGKIGNWILGMQNASSWQMIQHRETPNKLGLFGETHGKGAG